MEPANPRTNTASLTDQGLELLEEAECWRLAASMPVGRVAVSIGALPAVFPVNHAVVDGAIAFLTSPGTKLAAAVRHAVVAFEADSYELADRTGWSVLMIGMAEEVPPTEADYDGLRASLAPWVEGSRDRVVRIAPSFVSGRRIARARPSDAVTAARRVGPAKEVSWSTWRHSQASSPNDG